MTEISNSSTTSGNEPAGDLSAPPALASTPREITPRASRQSWKELPVRIWVILAVTVAVITTIFTVTRYFSGRHERWLITQGLLVPSAEIVRIQGTRERAADFKRTDRLQVELDYEIEGHPPFERVTGWLAQLPDQRPTPVVRVGEKIPIRVDPKDPTVWTDRTEPKGWLAEFTIVLLLLPLLVLLIAIALVRRRQVLRVWRNGELAAGVVVGLKQTAIAPLSRVVRFTLADGRDRRVFTTLAPSKHAPSPGDLLWLVFPAKSPGRAVIATLYQ